jgi:hypothetical protein
VDGSTELAIDAAGHLATQCVRDDCGCYRTGLSRPAHWRRSFSSLSVPSIDAREILSAP